MSAHLVSSDHYDLVISIWNELTTATRARSLQSIYDTEECEKYGADMNGLRKVLILQNIRSLAARYPTKYEEYFGEEFEPLLATQFVFCPEVHQWLVDKQWGKLYLPIRGYAYQSCEGREWEKSLAHTITEQVREDIIHLTTMATDDGAWTDYVRPKNYTGPVRLSALLD